VSARVIGIARRAGKLDLASYRMGEAAGEPGRRGERQVLFSREAGWISTPVVARRDLAKEMQGPVIIESTDTTAVVPPDAHVSSDEAGNLVLEMEASE
jgi:N-methylhydantoinase A